MRLLLQSIHNSLISCCFKDPNYFEGRDDDETQDVGEAGDLAEISGDSNSSVVSVGNETRQLLKTSLQSRIEEYQRATAKTGETIQGSAPTPFKREKSTNNMITQFENMTDSISLSSSSAHRRGPSPHLGASTDSQSSAMQTSIKHNVNQMPLCAACLTTIYPFDGVIHSYGRILHASCFTCCLCHAKLKHHPMEMHFELPEDNDALWCVCAKCQLEYLHKDTPKILATVAGEKIIPDEEELGDVQGVKDAIGDELEEIILEKTLPRCQVCSGDFLNYTGRVCIVGQMKYHKECWETGKPSVDLSERHLIPYQAAKYLPDRWILRLLVDDSKRRPLTTIFFVWKNRVQDFQRLLSTKQVKDTSVVSICLDLDDQARGNPNYHDVSKRKTQVQLLSGASLKCELIGNPLAGLLLHSTCESDRFRSILFRLRGTKYHVQHLVTLRVPMHDSKTLDLSKARLTITLRPEAKNRNWN